MSLLQNLIDFLVRRPWLPLALGLLLSAAAAWVCIDPQTLRPRLQVDASTERLLPADDADREVFERARAIFGDSDAVLMAVRLEPVFSADNLARIAALSDRLRQMPGVRGVYSLATAPNLLADAEAIEVSSFTDQAAMSPERIPLMAAELAANPIYHGSLVSNDGLRAAFAISLGEVDEDRYRREDFTGAFRRAAQEITGSSEIWITGSPVVKAATTSALLDTLGFTIPAIYALIVLLIFAAFRSAMATVAVVVTVTMALLWTAATAVLLELPLNLVTVITPPLVTTLGLAYSIHLLSDFFGIAARSREERQQRARQVMMTLSTGLLVSGTTTIAGFMALMPNILPAIRQFAILSSLGVIYAVLLVLFFLPALLDLLRCGRSARDIGERIARRLAHRIAAFDIKWRRHIIIIGLVLVPLNLWLASGIQVGTDYIKGFAASAPVRQDYEAINREFNGANLVSVLLETYVTDALTDPVLIRQVDELERWLRQQPEVGSAVSYVDHLKLVNQSMNDGDPAFHAIPDSAAAVKQLLIFGGGDEIRSVVDARFATALITLRLKVGDSIAIGDFVARVEQRLKSLPPPLDGKVTGSPVVATRTVNEIGRGQWQSVAIAAVAIWAMLALMFTSVRAGLWALLPNLLPVAMYFGMLRLLGIPLNPTNSLIASIVLGIAVDDTVHFLSRFNNHARALGNEAAAVKTTLAETLRPVTLTTIALCLGLLVFAGSELQSQVQFGLLASFTLFLAWISELFLTPALGSRLRIVTLWDLARLDLGRSPQHSIPVLAGLSLRQARVFALLSRLENWPAGHRVITHGEVARDMYVVLDGTVEAWIGLDDGSRKSLTQMTRGAVMGEAGYFGQRRTANVDAVTPVRLLRFDSQDLERLRRRYPRIAATVFRNLNRIQAERLARATAMLQQQ